MLGDRPLDGVEILVLLGQVKSKKIVSYRWRWTGVHYHNDG